MALADGLYRIRHSNPKLCLTLGKSDKIVGSSLYVDEQQDIAGQAWNVHSKDGGYTIQSAMIPELYAGFAEEEKKYTLVTAQEKAAKWYLNSMFGSAYTIVESSKTFAVGFSDYLPDAGNDTVLIDNVAAQSQIWYFEPWDLLKTDDGYLPTTDTSITDGEYQIVNVATGFLMTVTDRPSPSIRSVTKQKTQNLNWKVTLKRDGNKVTLGMPRVGGYMNIGPAVVSWTAAAEKFVLGKQKGERGFYIMSENETEARRVIVDNRQTPEGFEYYAADLKKGDPTQRWEFKPFKN